VYVRAVACMYVYEDVRECVGVGVGRGRRCCAVRVPWWKDLTQVSGAWLDCAALGERVGIGARCLPIPCVCAVHDRVPSPVAPPPSALVQLLPICPPPPLDASADTVVPAGQSRVVLGAPAPAPGGVDPTALAFRWHVSSALPSPQASPQEVREPASTGLDASPPDAFLLSPSAASVAASPEHGGGPIRSQEALLSRFRAMGAVVSTGEGGGGVGEVLVVDSGGEQGESG
jgi:hypothetical protein